MEKNQTCQKFSKGKVWQSSKFAIGVLFICSLFMVMVPMASAAAPTGSLLMGDGLFGIQQIVYRSATTGLETTIEVYDSGGEITAANDIKIIIPSELSGVSWDTSVTLATMDVTGNATGAVSGTVTYGTTNHTNDTLILDVTADFTSGDFVSISGPAFVATATPGGNGYLEWIVDGSTTESSVSDFLLQEESWDSNVGFLTGKGFLLDKYNTFRQCETAYPNGLGGSWSGTTCTINSPVTVTDKAIMVSHGVTLEGNGNLTIEVTASMTHSAALQLMGMPGEGVTVNDIIINGNTYLANGVLMSGNNVTLTDTTVTGVRQHGIYVSKNTDTFNLDGNVTSNLTHPFPTVSPSGVIVNHHSTNGTINNHTSSNNEKYGIHLLGVINTSITNSTISGNGDIGLYIQDFVTGTEYGSHLVQTTETYASTDIYVDSNTAIGNTTVDIIVDISGGAGAWDPAQSTATNTYSTIDEVQGTFPGNQTLPPGSGVPEFKDYMLIITFMIAFWLMVKLVPKINTGMRPV